MTTPEPIEQLNSLYNSLRDELQSLQSKVHLTDARDTVNEFETKIKGLPQTIRNLRTRRYVFETTLENQAVEMGQRWSTLRPSVEAFINDQARWMESALRPLDTRLTYISGQLNNPDSVLGLAQELERDVNNLKSKIDEAESSAARLYDELSEQLNPLSKHLNDLDYTLDQVEQACFKLTPSESIVMAIKATWTRDGKEDKDDPQGVLYLSDQRLIFEQKQEVATKKVLFITTERKLVQQVLLDIPIRLVGEVTGAKKGLFKNEDFLDLSLASGAPVATAQFHIFGQNFQNWIDLIQRATAHGFDKNSVASSDQPAVEKPKSVPATCPGCGSNLPQTIQREQETVVCEYCGFTIHLK
jgi:predicted  nucleic acid-binding Zn-ribbon protein